MITLYSWNVNGYRAVLKKDFRSWFEEIDADAVCLQETKVHPEQLEEEDKALGEYQSYFHAGERKGYSGVATFCRKKPKSVSTGFGDPSFEGEGRVLRTDFKNFILYNIYFPNGQKNEERLQYKLGFYDAFLEHLNALRDAGEKVIVCGDYNTAHHEIDLARPKQNEKTSGFLRIERDWMDKLVAEGYVDTFREFHPEGEHYSWWSFRAGARARNVGWRIDYFFVTPNLRKKLIAAEIHPDVHGSDHCPVSISLDYKSL